MRRAFLPTLFGLLALLLVLPAQAGVGWCRVDPVFSANGKVGHVLIAVQKEQHVNGATKVRISVPQGVDTHLLATDDGFGYGYAVTFRESKALKVTPAGIEVKIEVLVSSKMAQPVLVEFRPAAAGAVTAATLGDANTWITLTTVLP
jgi:hypothetical protein